MLNEVTDPIYETLMEGKLVNRLVLIAGVVLILYGAFEILGVYAEIWNQLLPSEPREETLQPVLTAFTTVVIGLVAVVLGVVMDFSWTPEESH